MFNIKNRFAYLMVILVSVGCESESVNYPSTTKVIGAAGGEIAVSGSAGEFALNIPPEALSGDVEITIQARGEAGGMSSVVKFEPSGLLFEKPVKLSFPAAAGRNVENPAVFYRGDNGALQPIESRSENGEIVADIDHFSSYAIADTMFEQSFCVRSVRNTFESSRCKLKGSSGPLRWGITEWGLEKPWNIAISLVNTTTDLVYVKLKSFEAENYLGTWEVQYWHSPELDYATSPSRDNRTRIEMSPMREYLGAVGGYLPNRSLGGYMHRDKTKQATVEICYDWLQFNLDGVIDEGSDCVTHMGEARADEPEGEVTWTTSSGNVETCATNCIIYSSAADRIKCCEYCADVHPLTCEDIR